MTSIRIRPRFEQELQDDPETIIQKIKSRLENNPEEVVGKTIPGFVVLKIPQKERHYWSPQLSLSLEEHNEGGTLIKGLYGPNPTVWGMFTLGYSAIGIVTLFVAIIGFSGKSLGMDAPVLWALPFLGGLAVLLYFTAQTGQKIGVEQTFTIHHFYEEAIGQKVHLH